MFNLICFALAFKARIMGRFLSRNIIFRSIILLAIASFFVLLSRHVLHKGNNSLYAGVSIIAITLLNLSYDKVEFYRQQFTKGACYLIQFSECLLVALPWIAMLFFVSNDVYYGLCLIGYCLIFPVVVRRRFSFSARIIPTLYSKSSYEFNYGFRSLLFLYLALFSLLLIGAIVKNNTLFIASAMGVVVFTSLTQNGNFVGESQWLRLYKCSAGRIIFSKIKQGSVNLLWLLSPILAVSVIDFQNLFFPALAVMAIGVLYYGFSILCRFVFFQQAILNGIIQVALLPLFTAIPFFPLLLLFIVPLAYLFYLRAVKSLKYLLHD